MQRLLTITMLLLLVFNCIAARHLETQRRALQAELTILQQQLTDLEVELVKNRALLDEAARRLATDALLLEQLRQWLDTWQVSAFEATAYAPFDAPPRGLCHDGNPSITATGTRPGPGTIAVDPRYIPFGTPLWVEGYGWGRALDTGAAMRAAANRLDLFFATRAAALAWGRRTVLVVLPRSRVEYMSYIDTVHPH
ncbi:MAG: hypothetical protein C4554_04760 [Dethiobacter sp.]|jgi:3D (Asp-Asp-Asp) domain-containing protein|nr:MAG: hypothetical protein C4554_04760 [Dethiobacter sp.]